MEYELGGCQPQEIPELVFLANRVFRPSGEGNMEREYPLLITSENAENLRVARTTGEEKSQIVSHVGICLRDVSLLGVRIRVASIGAVCTDPDHRGAGLASRLMTDAREHAIARGASLMLISGGRGLYRRLGYIPAGSFPQHRFPAAAAATTSRITAALLQPADLSAVIALQQCEPVRFRRPLEDWRKLLYAGTLMNQPSDLWVVRSEGKIVAYVGVQRPRQSEQWVRALEIGGARGRIAEVASGIAAHYQAPGLEITGPAGDLISGASDSLGLETSRASFAGTVGIIDPTTFLRSIRPLLTERADTSLELEPHHDGAILRAGGDEVELTTMAQLTALVFGSELEYQAALPDAAPVKFAQLSGVLPIPLPWYGYNYV